MRQVTTNKADAAHSCSDRETQHWHGHQQVYRQIGSFLEKLNGLRLLNDPKGYDKHAKVVDIGFS